MADDSKPTVRARPEARPPTRDPAPATGGARYANRDEIARGGMGRVVEAADTLLGRIVAIKEVLTTEPELLRRFARETRITARLEHPSIVPLYDAGTTSEGVPYYVMRKVSGKPLEELVLAADSVADRLALVPHVLATAQAVAHAHGRGILHRDLKPSNILAGDLGETVVIDWGLAKVVGEPDDDEALPAAVDAGASLRTRFGVVFGTPGFMAPEQVRGETVDERADVYALGATLYFVLARAVPHHAVSGDDMMAAAAAGPPRPLRELVTGVPPDLLTIVDTALAFAAGDRYRDAGAFAEELQRFLRGQLVASHRYNRRERVARFVRRNKVPVLAIGLATLALAIGGAFSVARIVAERDRADANAQLAARGQRDAEAAQHREAERADQLLLAQARTAVDTNPTLALALLKQLRATPERWHSLWRTARAIAAQARDRGIAYGMPGPEMTIHLEQSPDGTHALAAGAGGELWIYDLEARTGRLVATLPLYTFTFASDREIHCHGERTLVVVDIATGVQTRHELGDGAATIAAAGATVLWADHPGKLHVLDLTTGATAVLGDDVHFLTPSPDRRYVLATGGHTARVFDVQATPPAVVATVPGEVLRDAWDADSRHLALADGKRIAVLSLTGEPTAYFPTNNDVVGLALDDHLPAITTLHDRGLLWVGHDGKFHVVTTDRLELFPVPVGHRLAYISGRQIELFTRAQQLVLQPPAEVRWLAGHRNARHLVAAARGRVLLWDTEAMIPSHHSIPRVQVYVVPGPRDLFVLQDGVWGWLDLEHQTKVTFELPGEPLALSAAADRMHLVIASQGHAYVVGRGETTLDRLPIDDVEIVTLDAEGRVLAGTKAGALIRLDLATHAQETLVVHPSPIDAFRLVGPWQVVQYADGFMWRRNTTTGVATTLQLATPPPSLERMVTVGLAPTGDVTAVADRTVVRWTATGEVRELAALPTSIRELLLTEDVALAGTDHGALFTIGLTQPGPLREDLAAGSLVNAISPSTGMAAYITPKGETRIADLLAGESWPALAAVAMRIETPVISADGAQLVGVSDGSLVVFDLALPRDERATAAWLDQLTNATTHGAASLDWE